MKTVAPCNRIFEEGNLRRKESQNGKLDTDHAYQDESCPGMQAAGVLLLEKRVFQPECGTRGDEKDSNVQPVCRYAENSGIGVVDDGYQCQSQHNANQLYAPELAVFLSPTVTFYQSEQQHWVIDQLHVLPNRFIHRGKESGYDALTAQVKQKMKKGSEYGCKQKACDLPMGDCSIHMGFLRNAMICPSIFMGTQKI